MQNRNQSYAATSGTSAAAEDAFQRKKLLVFARIAALASLLVWLRQVGETQRAYLPTLPTGTYQ